MKKPNTASASAQVSTENTKGGITRRAFLKGTAGFVLLCGSGFALRGLAELPEPAQTPIGPQLREELRVVPTADGARVAAGAETCFTVNEAGLVLLDLADGSHTLEELTELSGMSECAESVADFFLALGMAGYLTARLEVNKVAVRM